MDVNEYLFGIYNTSPDIRKRIRDKFRIEYEKTQELILRGIETSPSLESVYIPKLVDDFEWLASRLEETIKRYQELQDLVSEMARGIINLNKIIDDYEIKDR